MMNFKIAYFPALFILLFAMHSSCHIQKENTTLIKKDYLYIIWVEKVIADNNKLPEQERLLRQKESRAFQEKALSLKKKKQFVESIQFLEFAIDKEINADLYYEYANVLSSAKRFHEAIKAYEISLKLEYKRPELVLYNIACAYSLLNEEENTYKYLEKAIQKGYNAFEYIEKDPDLKNIREKSSEWEWKRKIKSFTFPNREVYTSDVIGLISQLAGGSRLSSYFFICKNGTIIRSDYQDWQCAKYGFTRGKWKITDNQLEFRWEESCKPLGENAVTPLASNGFCSFTHYVFQFCQSIQETSKENFQNIPRFEKVDFKYMLYDQEGFDNSLKRRKTKTEPPQCDPDFLPRNMNDLDIVKYFYTYYE